MTADPGETRAGTADAGTAADLTAAPEAAAADVPPELLAQSLGQYLRAWWLRVRSGNSGVLPVVLAMVLVAVVFEIVTPEHAFLRPSNLVYIFGLSTVYMVLAMAETVVLLLGGDRPLGRRGRAYRRGDRLQAGPTARAGLAVVGSDARGVARLLRRDRRRSRGR